MEQERDIDENMVFKDLKSGLIVLDLLAGTFSIAGACPVLNRYRWFVRSDKNISCLLYSRLSFVEDKTGQLLKDK